jgi:hypothetical protein
MKFLIRLIVTGIGAWFIMPVIFTILVVMGAGYEETADIRRVFLVVSICAGWPLLMLLWYRADDRYLRSE